MFVRFLAGLALLLLNTSCSDFSEQEVSSINPMQSSEEQLAKSGLDLMEKNTQGLAQSVRNLHSVLENSCEDSSKENKNIESAYRNLIQQFYHFSLFSLATKSEEIYYSILNRCLVDTQVILTKQKELLPETLHPSIKGLLAIEYLLFEKSLVSACSPSTQPQTVQWNALSEAEKRKDRCRHALVLTQKVKSWTDQLEKKWSAKSNSDYEKNLTELEYTHSPKNLVKLTIQYMGNLEKSKDNILGIPLGLNSLCESETQKCVEKVPFVYSDLGLSAVVGALQSFKSIFLNVEKYLNQKGKNDLASNIKQAVNTALATAQLLDTTQGLRTYVVNMNPQLCRSTTLDPLKPNEPICLLFKQVELITDIYKTDLLTFMSLEVQSDIPQGDND